MDHSKCVEDGCRVCGGRLGKYRVSYDCHTVVKLHSIGLSVEKDTRGVIPRRDVITFAQG